MHRELFLRRCPRHVALLGMYYFCHTGRKCGEAGQSSLGCPVLCFNYSGALELCFREVFVVNHSLLPYSIFLPYHETENKSQRKEMTSLLCWSQLATGIGRESW